ncbi:MAG: hypothetical protein KJ607_02195 [Bacteroidetes bacterium]|nr:hypothetical protein [Bacteroidota bacterium]
MKKTRLYISLMLVFFTLSTILYGQQHTKEEYEAFKKDIAVTHTLVKFGQKKSSPVPLMAAAEILMKHSYAMQSKSDTLNPGKILDKAMRFAQIQGSQSLIDKVLELKKKYAELVKAENTGGESTGTGDANIKASAINANSFYYERFILKPGKKHTVKKAFKAKTNAEVRVMTAEEDVSLEVKLYVDGKEVPDITPIDECNETGVEWTPPKEIEYTIEIKNMSELEAECFLFTN